MSTSLLVTGSIWLHTMATIMLIGHYLLMTMIYLPVLNRRFDGQGLFELLADIYDKVRLRIYAALGVFAVTGITLMLVNESYQGIGNFGNAWSVLMVAKHLLVSVMVVLAVMLNNTIRSGLARQNEVKKSLDRLHILLSALSVSGVLVILLTAFAQA